MEHTRKPMSTMTEHDRQMAAKLERIIEDPEAYYAAARKAAYRDELRRALMPRREHHPRSASTLRPACQHDRSRGVAWSL